MNDTKINMVDCQIYSDGWIVCGVCRHKLARIENNSDEKFTETTNNSYVVAGKQIVFKCHSCKTINLLK